MLVLYPDSLRVYPMFKHILITCFTILLKIKDFTLASNAKDFCVVDVNENAMIKGSLLFRMLF